MKKRPTITPWRAAEVFEEMLSCRRDYCADGHFPKMSTVWRDLCDASNDWKLRTYRSRETDDFKRRAAVIALDGRVTLTVDEQLMVNADLGCKLSNFMLAHELGHVGLDHHARGAVIKNFQLFKTSEGMANIPPTNEELETNYAGVFFQCGSELLSTHDSPLQLAGRAYSDVSYVKKALALVRTDAFRRELARPRTKRRRVIL